VGADAHRRVDEAVSERPAGEHSLLGVLDLLRGGARPVEHEAVVVGPDLGVARHRLVVQAHCVEVRREEHAHDLVLVSENGELVLVPVNAVPAVRAREGLAHQGIGKVVRQVPWPRLVHPPGLGDLDPMAAVATRRAEQRDLHRSRQLCGEAQVCRHAPEHEAAREREQVQRAVEVPGSDALGERAERPEGEQVADALERPGVVDRERRRPRREHGLPLRPRVVAARR
jgi:hypothetical protein